MSSTLIIFNFRQKMKKYYSNNQLLIFCSLSMDKIKKKLSAWSCCCFKIEEEDNLSIVHTTYDFSQNNPPGKNNKKFELYENSSEDIRSIFTSFAIDDSDDSDNN